MHLQQNTNGVAAADGVAILPQVAGELSWVTLLNPTRYAQPFEPVMN